MSLRFDGTLPFGFHCSRVASFREVRWPAVRAAVGRPPCQFGFENRIICQSSVSPVASVLPACLPVLFRQ